MMNGKMEDSNICSICLDEKELIILEPCLHQCICNECLNKLISYSSKCPICRCKIFFKKNIYINIICSIFCLSFFSIIFVVLLIAIILIHFRDN